MEINDFLGIGIIGVALSVFIEGIKIKYGPTSLTTKVITLLLALGVGTLYVLLSSADWWTTVLGILGAASAVYAFFFK